MSHSLLHVLLVQGKLMRGELKDSVPYISPSSFDRVLHRLALAGLILSRRSARDRRQRCYELTPAAKELLAVAYEVTAIEAWAPPALRGPHSPPLLSALANEIARLISHKLVDGPLSYTELRARLPEVADSTFAERLASLASCGLVCIRADCGQTGRAYELTELVPALARTMARAARLRLHMTPRDTPWLAGDLSSFLKLLELAPTLRAAPSVRGAVLLHVIQDDSERSWPDVEVTLHHGRIFQRRPGTGMPSTSARALPGGWWDAILDEDLLGVEIKGDVDLFHRLWTAISAVTKGLPASLKSRSV